MSAVQELSGWGRWPRRECVTAPLRPAAGDGAPSIARGLGRAYGDAAMAPPMTLTSTHRSRLLSFDEATGDLVAEAGLSLADLLEVFVPRGWFPPVTPGSKFVTLGGLVAADAHGKNHHGGGSFGDHVAWIDLLCADGEVRRCSPQENAGLLAATLGGMGLTGHVLTVALRLRRIETAWVVQRTIAAPHLDAAIEAFEDNLDATYSVAWIDCLARGASRGRSLVHVGEHAAPGDLPPDMDPLAKAPRRALRMPMDAPSWALNPLTLRAFNEVYHRAGARRPGPEVVDLDRCFYPLDAIADWNRLYGRRGFAQHQCALPLATSRDALWEMLGLISDAGLGSFLAVLKRLGPGAHDRPLSFPIEGYTLALDFALSPAALTLMDRLDEVVVAAGGRLYLAKDSRMSQATFEAGYGEGAAAFRRLREETGARGAFGSLLSRRLGL